MCIKMQRTLNTVSAANNLFIFLQEVVKLRACHRLWGWRTEINKLAQEKKQGRRVRLKPWSAHGQAPVQTPLMPKKVVVLQSHHPPAPNSPSPHQHTQTGSIVSKAAAGTGALRCLQHANPGRALLALCLRGLPGHP